MQPGSRVEHISCCTAENRDVANEKISSCVCVAETCDSTCGGLYHNLNITFNAVGHRPALHCLFSSPATSLLFSLLPDRWCVLRCSLCPMFTWASRGGYREASSYLFLSLCLAFLLVSSYTMCACCAGVSLSESAGTQHYPRGRRCHVDRQNSKRRFTEHSLHEAKHDSVSFLLLLEV